MSKLTKRLERDLSEIAGRAAPSPSALSEIRRRPENEQQEGDEDELIVVSLDRRVSRTPRHLVLTVAAALLIIASGFMLRAQLDPPELTVATCERVVLGPVQPSSKNAAGPGRFETTIFRPSLRITVGDNWLVGSEEYVDYWQARLPQADAPALDQAAVHVWLSDAASPIEVIETAVGRGFRMSEAESVEVGGLPGQRYEVLSGALNFLDAGGLGGLRIGTPQNAYRVTIVQVGDHVVVLGEFAPRESPETIAAARAETEQVVATIRWPDHQQGDVECESS